MAAKTRTRGAFSEEQKTFLISDRVPLKALRAGIVREQRDEVEKRKLANMAELERQQELRIQLEAATKDLVPVTENQPT